MAPLLRDVLLSSRVQLGDGSTTLPSPACAPLVGQTVTVIKHGDRNTVDKFSTCVATRCAGMVGEQDMTP